MELEQSCSLVGGPEAGNAYITSIQRSMKHVQDFYERNTQIQLSHGWNHVRAVHRHAYQAISCHRPPLALSISMEIQIAVLLHDVDDCKYFPENPGKYVNARQILASAEIPAKSIAVILYMISLVSCSANGNDVPSNIIETGNYHLLIPRWSDRLEAVGKAGVIRCYQYSMEVKRPLSSAHSPRARTVQEVWDLATPGRFKDYRTSGGVSFDMISHYYDKLLQVARPPQSVVRNSYLERKAEESSRELVEICLRYGKIGRVDIDYIEQLALCTAKE